MTVKELIIKLQKLDQDKVVVIADINNFGWTNIEDIIENKSTVSITEGDMNNQDLMEDYL